MKEQALKCLALIPKPELPVDDMRSSMMRRSLSSTDSQKSIIFNPRNPDHKDILNHVIDVGKALKSVDRTLFYDFAKWCDKVSFYLILS